jgi:hypothetical protein
MLSEIDKINSVTSLRLGVYLIGPVLFGFAMFVMWMQVVEFQSNHEYWRILSFCTHYLFTLLALYFIRKCYRRLKVIKSIG